LVVKQRTRRLTSSMWTLCRLSVVAAILVSGANTYYRFYSYPKTAVVELVAGSSDEVTGHIYITSVNQPYPGVVMVGTIFGLKPGKHGFHVHMEGDLGNKCKDAKGHFNPAGADHSGPLDAERHAGDLGNIITRPDGVTHVYISDRRITLGDGGDYDIAGRSIVVHAGEDDLGRGGDDESKKTGNAGARLVCGKINVVQPNRYYS